MGSVTMTKLYQLLSLKVGKETAENLTSYIEEKVNEEFNNKVQIFATKEDLANTKTDIIKDLANSKTDIIKWMFVFWISQVCATFGFLLLYLKK